MHGVAHKTFPGICARTILFDKKPMRIPDLVALREEFSTVRFPFSFFSRSDHFCVSFRRFTRDLSCDRSLTMRRSPLLKKRRSGSVPNTCPNTCATKLKRETRDSPYERIHTLYVGCRGKNISGEIPYKLVNAVIVSRSTKKICCASRHDLYTYAHKNTRLTCPF